MKNARLWARRMLQCMTDDERETLVREYLQYLEPLTRLRHLLPARRGEKGNRAQVSRESGLLPLAPLAGRGCRRRVRGCATSDALPSCGVSCPQSRLVRRSAAQDDSCARGPR